MLGVFHCTFGAGMFYADFDDRFQAESGWNIDPSSGVHRLEIL